MLMAQCLQTLMVSSLSLCSAATSYAAGLETLEVHCAATAAFFLQHNKC